MRSERARKMMQDYEYRVRRLLKQEVHGILEAIEKEAGSHDSAQCFERVYAKPKIPPSAFFLFTSQRK